MPLLGFDIQNTFCLSQVLLLFIQTYINRRPAVVRIGTGTPKFHHPRPERTIFAALTGTDNFCFPLPAASADGIFFQLVNPD